MPRPEIYISVHFLHIPYRLPNRELRYVFEIYMVVRFILDFFLHEKTKTYAQRCSGAGTRGNGVPTSFSHFALD